MPSPPKTIAVVGDLFFKEKIRQTAEIVGAPLVFASTEPALRDALAPGDAAQVIVDLGIRSIDPVAALSMVREAGGLRSIAYVSHVDDEAQRRAREAGCDRVLPKSAFTRDLARILEGAI